MRVMRCNKVSVKLVDGTVMVGTVNTGSSRRLSDFFNKKEPGFLVIFDVCVGTRHHEVLFVNRRHILWAEPQDEDKSCAPREEDDVKPCVDTVPGP